MAATQKPMTKEPLSSSLFPPLPNTKSNIGVLMYWDPLGVSSEADGESFEGEKLSISFIAALFKNLSQVSDYQMPATASW